MSFFQSQNDYNNYLTNIANQAQTMANTYGSSYADMLNQTESAAALYQNSQIESKQLNAQGLDDLLFSAPLFKDSVKPLIARGKTAFDYLNTALDKAKGSVSNVEDLIRRAQKLKDGRNIINTSSNNQEVRNALYEPYALEELPESLSATTTDLALQAKKDFILSNSNNDPKVLTKVVNGTDAEVEDLYKTTLENAPIGAKNRSPMEGIRSGEMVELKPPPTGSAFKELTSGESMADRLLRSPQGQSVSDAINNFRLRNVETGVGEIRNPAFQPNELFNEIETTNPAFNPDELPDIPTEPVKMFQRKFVNKYYNPPEGGTIETVAKSDVGQVLQKATPETGTLENLIPNLRETLQSGVEPSKELISGATSKVSDIISGISSDLPSISDASSKVSDLVASASSKVSDLIASSGKKIGNLVSFPRSEKTRSVFGDAYNYMSGEKMVPVLPNPKQLLTGSDIMTSAKSTGEDIVSGAKEGLQSAMTTSEGILSSAKQGAEGLISSAKQGFQGAMETGQNIANTGLETLESAKSNLTSKFESLTDSIPKLPSSLTGLSSESDVSDVLDAVKDIGGSLVKEESTSGALLGGLGEVGEIGLAGYGIYEGIRDFIQGKSSAPPQQQIEAPIQQSSVQYAHSAGVY